jgi:hypothetical protein
MTALVLPPTEIATEQAVTFEAVAGSALRIEIGSQVGAWQMVWERNAQAMPPVPLIGGLMQTTCQLDGGDYRLTFTPLEAPASMALAVILIEA